MGDDLDLLAICRPGTVHRTRDRRDARIDRISPEEGLIYGEVRMHGPCVWRSDGRYRDAPFGAAGPLDIIPPERVEAPTPDPRHASVKAALDEDNRVFCCD